MFLEFPEREISLIPLRRELTVIPVRHAEPKRRSRIRAEEVYKVLVSLSLYALPFLLVLAGWLLKLIGVTE